MSITFNYVKTFSDGEFVEYSIFIGDEIFCHLSDESDFQTFKMMCIESGNKLLRRI